MNNDRLVEIEIKIAYQEETIQALNDVICNQQKQIDQLEKTCQLLFDRLKNLSPATLEASPPDEKPPHY
jgi:SlyX protein